jgi:diguanylate cyclase (GGDEF)-like protein
MADNPTAEAGDQAGTSASLSRPRAAPILGDELRFLPLAAGPAVGLYAAALLVVAHERWLALAALLAGAAAGLALDASAPVRAAVPVRVAGYLLGICAIGLSLRASGLAALAYGPWIALGAAAFPTWETCAGFAAAEIAALWLGRAPAGAPAVAGTAAASVAIAVLHMAAVLAARQAQARSHLALTDPLTGLANRRLLAWRLAEEAAQARRTDGGFALVYLDLRDFRSLNLRAGRRAGDRVLVQVAQILRDTMRAHDVIARMDGDDFAILAPGLSEPDAAAVVERVRAAVSRATTLAHPVRLAAGWAIAPRDGLDPDVLMETAASAVFEQKLQSRPSEPALPVELMTALWGLPEGAQQLVRLLHTEGIEQEAHVSRVGQWSLELARMVGLDEDRQAALAQAALVHDVGKLVLPRSLLRKPGPLTPEEHASLVRHVTSGVGLLRAVGVGEPVLSIVAAHHERWDGTGYPNRLAGAAIPIEARILAIADGCDAMTERRPYRKAWTVDEAAADVQLEGGRQFDPELVNLIIPVLSAY